MPKPTALWCRILSLEARQRGGQDAPLGRYRTEEALHAALLEARDSLIEGPL
jgi:hypothetical protein